MPTNVTSVTYKTTKWPEVKIKDMVSGQIGYTVPWAYNEKDKMIDERFTIAEKSGAASLCVECVKPGTYSLTFE